MRVHIDAPLYRAAPVLELRYKYTLQNFSAGFQNTELAQCFARLFTERNSSADRSDRPHTRGCGSAVDPDWLRAELVAPVLIASVSGGALTESGGLALRTGFR